MRELARNMDDDRALTSRGLAFALLLALTACTPRETHDPSDAPRDAAPDAGVSSILTLDTTPLSVADAHDGTNLSDAAPAVPSIDKCRCTALSTPKPIASGGPAGGTSGLGYVLVTDDVSLYYSPVYLYGSENEYCAMDLTKRSIATGKEQKVFDELLWCSGGARVSGGRFYFNTTQPESSYAVRDFHSVSVKGGPVTPHPSWWMEGASRTHVYWLERGSGAHHARMSRRLLSGGPSTVVREDVDYPSGMRFIESGEMLYWAEKVPRSKAGDSGAAAVDSGAAASDARLALLGAEDDAGAFEGARVIPGAGDSLGTLTIRGDSAYWWNGKCVVGAKLDGSAGECVVNLKEYSNLSIKGDYAYWSATPASVARASLRGPAGNPPETIVRCDADVRDFVAAPETLFFSCRDTLWSVAMPSSAASRVGDASSD